MTEIGRVIFTFLLKTKIGFIYSFLSKLLSLSRFLDAKRSKSRIIKVLNKNYPQLQVCLYDVGAAGGLERTFRPLLGLNHFQALGFEPGEAETIHSRTPSFKLYPFAIAGIKGTRELYITRLSHCSSLYPPNTDVIREFPIANFFEVIDQETIEVVSIQDFIAENKVIKPDYLKIDVQGAEFEILQGEKTVVNDLIGIYFESRLREVYTGESLFSDIHPLLLKNGFRLVSCKASPFFSGEVIELNVAYVKSAEHLLTEQNLVKAILFCACHENLNYAAHLIRNAPIPSLDRSKLLRLLSKRVDLPEDLEVTLLKAIVAKAKLY